MSYLERIAERVESFYVDLAAISLYHPEREANPARARWRFVQRRVKDGSFFVLTRNMVPLNLDKPVRVESAFERKRNNRQSISFDQVLSQAVSSVSKSKVGRAPPREHTRSASKRSVPEVPSLPPATRPLRLADAHTARARGPTGSTSYEDQILSRAANRMSQFMTRRVKDINRLSKATGATNLLSLDHAMSVYGAPSRGQDHDSDDSGSASPTDTIGTISPRSYPVTPLSGQRRTNMTPSSYGGSQARMTPSRSNSIARSDGGRSIRSAMSKSDLHAATFNRKLSVYGSGSVSGGPSPSDTRPPPLPTKESHW